MGTLMEIESAATALPAPQQRNLLIWLQGLVEQRPQPAAPQATRREVWLQKLAERRRRGLTGKDGTPLQQIMDDMRGD